MMLEIVDGYSRDFKVKFGGDKIKISNTVVFVLSDFVMKLLLQLGQTLGSKFVLLSLDEWTFLWLRMLMEVWKVLGGGRCWQPSLR
ncbi:hypothetical protein FHG87_016348 [Trinorchestia longiramus]|nr:hypothetical protein FHG87_016348 [Trinorchestia longiramus]